MLADTAGSSDDGLNFQMMREDTLSPSLTRLEPLPNLWLRLRFDKPMALPESMEEGIQIRGTQGALAIQTWFLLSGSPQTV